MSGSVRVEEASHSLLGRRRYDSNFFSVSSSSSTSVLHKVPQNWDGEHQGENDDENVEDHLELHTTTAAR